jgi:hypothetical protein
LILKNQSMRSKTMALNHAAATATIIMDGLAVCCFNKNGKHPHWQVGFLHQPHHDVNLRVSTTAGDVIVDPKPLTGAKRIRIYTEGGIRPDYENTFKGGFFDNGPVDRKVDPATVDETENFRWVVDLESDLGHERVFLKKPAKPVVLTTIFDAVFYNKRVTLPSPHLFYVLPDGINPNPLPPEQLRKHLFGHVNDVVAADIVCEEGGRVIVEIDGKIEASLDAKPDLRYLIDLNNMRHHHKPPPGRGRDLELVDFSLYYDILDVDRKVAMWAVLPRDERSGRVSCNLCRLSVTDDLSDLTG